MRRPGTANADPMRDTPDTPDIQAPSTHRPTTVNSTPAAPLTLPTPLVMPVAPWKWETVVASAPVVVPLRDDGTAGLDADTFTLKVQAVYDATRGGGSLALEFDGLPLQHALPVTARILRTLYPGPRGYTGDAHRGEGEPHGAGVVGAAETPWSVDRERLAAQLAEAVDQLEVMTAERDALAKSRDNALRDNTDADTRIQTLTAELAALGKRADATIKAVEGAIADREAAEARAESAESEAEALRGELATLRTLREIDKNTAADADAQRASLAAALEKARADLTVTRTAHRDAEAARVQLAAEFEAMRGEMGALREESSGWQSRAVRAETGNTAAAPTAGMGMDDVAAATEAAVAPWRTKAEEATRAYDGLLEATSGQSTEIATLRAQLASLGVSAPSAAVGPVVAPLAPRVAAPEGAVDAAPQPPVVLATPLTPRAPETAGARHYGVGPDSAATTVRFHANGDIEITAPQATAPASAPAPDPWSVDDTASVSAPVEAPAVAPSVAPAPPAPPASVAPPAAPTTPGLRPLPSLPRLAGAPVAAVPTPPVAPAAPVPTAPATAPALPAIPEATSPFAPGMAPGSPPTSPLPSGGGVPVDPNATLTNPDVAALVAKETYFRGAIQVLIREGASRGVTLDFDLLCAEVIGLRELLAGDGRPAVPVFARLPVASVRERVASIVTAYPDCGITVPDGG